MGRWLQGRWRWLRKHPKDPDRDWDAYVSVPYQNHQQYIDDIHSIMLLHPDELCRRNSRGQTVRQVLINGASWGHYSYLQNGGHAIHSLSAEGRRLWGMGTCTNEALHSEFNNTQRVTVQQHVESMRAVISMFSLAKLLAHQSAAYYATTSQRSQSQLLALLEGFMRQNFCAPFSSLRQKSVVSRRSLRAPVHQLLPAHVQPWKEQLARQKSRWARHLLLRPRPPKRGTVKRTVFTKRKEVKPHAAKKWLNVAALPSSQFKGYTVILFSFKQCEGWHYSATYLCPSVCNT